MFALFFCFMDVNYSGDPVYERQAIKGHGSSKFK